jgi:hypothetical protein
VTTRAAPDQLRLFPGRLSASRTPLTLHNPRRGLDVHAIPVSRGCSAASRCGFGPAVCSPALYPRPSRPDGVRQPGCMVGSRAEHDRVKQYRRRLEEGGTSSLGWPPSSVDPEKSCSGSVTAAPGAPTAEDDRGQLPRVIDVVNAARSPPQLGPG